MVAVVLAQCTDSGIAQLCVDVERQRLVVGSLHVLQSTVVSAYPEPSVRVKTEADDVVVLQSRRLSSPVAGSSSRGVQTEESSIRRARPETAVAVGTEAVDEGRVELLVGRLLKTVGRGVIASQSLRRGHPEPALAVACKVEDGIRWQSVGEQVAAHGARGQVVAEESPAEGAYPHLLLRVVIMEGVHVGAQRVGMGREGSKAPRAGVVDVDAGILGGQPDGVRQLSRTSHFGHLAHHLAVQLSVCIAGFVPFKLPACLQQDINATKVAAYPQVAVAVVHDAVDGVVAEHGGRLEAVLQDVGGAVGVNDGDALFRAQPNVVVVVLGDGTYDAVGQFMRLVDAREAALEVDAHNALPVASQPQLAFVVEGHGYDAVDAGGECLVVAWVQPGNLCQRGIVGIDRCVAGYVELVVGADGHGHDETYLECGVLYEGVALFVVDAEVVAAANDTSLRCLYQAEHVLRAFVIGGKVVGGGTVATDAQLGAHPYPSFTVAVYHFDEIVAQRVGVLVVVEVGVHLVAVVAHQSVACSYPDVAFLVLCHGLHLLMRQTVLTAEVAETIVGRSTECENTEIKESKNGQETFHLAKCFLLLRMYDGVGGHARHIALELHGADVHATGGYHRFGVVGMEDDAQSSLQAVRRARAALATQHT